MSTEPPTETSTAVHLERARLEIIERLEGTAESRILRIRTRAAVHGVRGTIVAFRSSDCPGADRSIDTIEVTEGSVETVHGTTPPVIEAGQRVESCVGCPEDAPPRCCDPSTCAAGCCSREDRCETGDTPELCGAVGGACESCWHPSLPYCDYRLRSCRGQHCYTTFVDVSTCQADVLCNDGTTYSTLCTADDPDGRIIRCTCTSSRGANETRTDDTGACPFTSGFRVGEEVPYVPFCYHYDA